MSAGLLGWDMKESTRENIKITIAALFSVAVVLAVGIVLELHQINWQKWFGLVWWTGVVFGLLASGYGRKLRRPRPLAIFLVALGLHLSVMTIYLRSANDFPNLAFLFIGTLEAVLVVVAMTLLTDLDYHLPGRTRVRREKWPPPGWGRDRAASKKRKGPE